MQDNPADTTARKALEEMPKFPEKVSFLVRRVVSKGGVDSEAESPSREGGSREGNGGEGRGEKEGNGGD